MSDHLSCLEWDTSFFGQRVGKLLLQPQLQLEAELTIAKNERYGIVYIFSPDEVVEFRTHELSVLDVGGQVKYVKTLTASSRGESNESIVRFNEIQLTSDIINLSYLSGHLSRFRIDPFLPAGSFEKLYLTWIANIHNRPCVAAIYIYYVEGVAVGMITSECSSDACTIGLLAVHPSYQGLGIGTHLLRHLEYQCIDTNVSSLEVKTQLTNVSAQSLYLKNHFLEVNRSFLYHAHILSG